MWGHFILSPVTTPQCRTSAAIDISDIDELHCQFRALPGLAAELIEEFPVVSGDIPLRAGA
jgi:hypothetical protein